MLGELVLRSSLRVLDAPEPVKGSDGKYHLVYELVLTNSSPGTATVESVKTMDAKSGEVVGPLAGPDVAARTVRLGDISGQVALLFLDVRYDDLRDVPKAVEHRVKTSFDIPSGFGSNFPHLHFHVMDAPLALGADHNLPYVFDSFVYQGHFRDDLTSVLLKNREPREDELPLDQSIVTFPAPRGY